jgi:hypothetical protein
MEYIEQGGYMMWPLIAIAIAVLGLSVWSWTSLPGNRTAADAVVETRIDSVLFWGAYGVVLGILGTLIGIAQAASAIQAFGAETVSAALVWGGIQVAMITVIFGFLIFSVALVAWFALRVRYRRRIAAV